MLCIIPGDCLKKQMDSGNDMKYLKKCNCQILQILVTKKHFHTQTVAATFLLLIAGSLWG